MAVSHNFRSALNGFNRQDVVHYIEYLNTRHSSQINQLTAENDECRKKAEGLSDRNAELEKSLKAAAAAEAELLRQRTSCTDLEEQLNALREQLDLITAERDSAAAEVEALKATCQQQQQQALTAQELEAYRRAERTERLAQERAEQIYQQATGTLAQATTQVDTAAERFRQVADRIGKQMVELQGALEISRSALVDAATTMYSICPENAEE